MNTQEIIAQAKNVGFTTASPLDISTIKLMPEVREMCATNSCQRYGKSWSCPPACGALETCEKSISQYSNGVLLQTVGELEDCWDFEGMQDTEKLHKQHFFALVDILSESNLKMLPISAGSCTVCKECTYPDSPCRFPTKAMSSMEAYGMLVNEICKSNDVEYNHGTNTICYTSCILFCEDD